MSQQVEQMLVSDNPLAINPRKSARGLSERGSDVGRRKHVDDAIVALSTDPAQTENL